MMSYFTSLRPVTVSLQSEHDFQIGDIQKIRLYTISGLDWWTGLVDWTTGLIDFHLKCTEMLRNVAQSITVAISVLGPGKIRSSKLLAYTARARALTIQ